MVATKSLLIPCTVVTTEITTTEVMSRLSSRARPQLRISILVLVLLVMSVTLHIAKLWSAPDQSMYYCPGADDHKPAPRLIFDQAYLTTFYGQHIRPDDTKMCPGYGLSYSKYSPKYDVKFGQNGEMKTLCSAKFNLTHHKTPFDLSRGKLDKVEDDSRFLHTMMAAIREGYQQQLIADGLQVKWCFLSPYTPKMTICANSFPIGCYIDNGGLTKTACPLEAKYSNSNETDIFFVFNHIDFVVSYKRKMDSKCCLITQVQARVDSIDHASQDRHKAMAIPGDLSDLDYVNISYTYSVFFNHSEQSTRGPATVIGADFAETMFDLMSTICMFHAFFLVLVILSYSFIDAITLRAKRVWPQLERSPIAAREATVCSH